MSRKTRKLIWSAPLVAVLAVVGALALFVALSPNGAQADHVELPGPVTGLKATANGQNEINVSWKAPSTGGTPTSYRIDVSKDSYSWMALEADVREGTSHTHMGLKGGNLRYYRVFAKNAAGTGPVAENPNYDFARTAAAVAPDPVLQLRTTSVTHNQIELAWTAPASTGGKTIKRYCIEAKPTGQTLVTAIPLTSCTATATISDLGTTAPGIHEDGGAFEQNGGIIILGRSTFALTHKNLVAGSTWRYRAFVANDQGGSGAASNLLTVTTPVATKPDAPSHLRIVPTVEGADLWWNWPASDGGSDITNFIVEESTDKGKTWTTEAGSPIAVATAQTQPTSSATLATPQENIASADAGTRYRVRATNDADAAEASKWSLPSNSVTVDDARRIPEDNSGATNVPAYIKGPGAPNVTATMAMHLRRIDLSWTRAELNGPPVGHATGYYIDVSTDGETWMPLEGDTSWSRPTYNHTRNLDPNKMRYYRVFGEHEHNVGMPGAGTGSTKAATTPDPVRGLTATADGPTRIKLSWGAPAENGGYDIIGYRIEIANDDDDNATLTATPWPVATVIPTVEEDACSPALPCVRETVGVGSIEYTYKESSLDAGEARWFRVFAINKENEDTGPSPTDMGSAKPVRGMTATASAPQPPVDLTTEEAKDSDALFYTGKGALILWNAPEDPDGGEVTGYILSRRTKMGDEAWSEWDDDWGEITNASPDLLRTYYTDIAEPSEDEMREYRIKATSASGNSAWSSVVVYPADTSHTAVPSDLGMASNIRIGINSGGSIQVTWDAADNADGYIVIAIDRSDFSAKSAPINPNADGITATTWNLGGLTVGNDYYIYVAATGSAGDNTLSLPPVEVTAN